MFYLQIMKFECYKILEKKNKMKMVMRKEINLNYW